MYVSFKSLRFSRYINRYTFSETSIQQIFLSIFETTTFNVAYEYIYLRITNLMFLYNECIMQTCLFPVLYNICVGD